MQQREQKCLEVLSVVFLTALLAYTMLGTRILVILGRSEFQSIVNYVWMSIGIICSLIALYKKPSFVIWITLIFLLLLGHSYSHLYRPSLASGIPKLDYHFFQTVSSNYCFDMAKSYLTNTYVPLMAFASALFVFENQLLKLYRIITILLLIFFGINLLVVGVQGAFDINLLGEGSGSSLSLMRAPGLLEDSGASTVVISSLMIYFFVLLSESKFDAFRKILLFALLLFAFYVGHYTTGRVYYSLTAIGIVFYALAKFYASQADLRVKWAMVVFALSSFVIFVVIKSEESFFQGLYYKDTFASENLFVRLFALIDPVRAVHVAIFLKSIPEYWPSGIGFGGAHIALAEYKAFFEAKGVTVSGDAPLNYFLGLIAEIGIVAVVFMLATMLRIRDFTILLRSRTDLGSYVLAMLTLSACLLASMMVGTQIIFRSFSAVFMLWFATIIIVPGMIKHERLVAARIRSFVTFAMGAALVLATAVQFKNIPLVPEFLWSKQGYPQSPLGLSIPIAGPSAGKWLSSRVPFVLSQRNYRFFIELPPEFYPLHVKVEVFDNKHLRIYSDRHEIPEYSRQSPGKTFKLPIESDALSGCLDGVSPERFCYVTVKTSPEWIYNELPIGFFLIDDAPQS